MASTSSSRKSPLWFMVLFQFPFNVLLQIHRWSHQQLFFLNFSSQSPCRSSCRYYLTTILFSFDILLFTVQRSVFFIVLFNWVAQKGGCMVVDSTRRGKRFPDSMSKTIPIWTCVLNRAISQFRTDSNIHENDAALPQVSLIMMLISIFWFEWLCTRL